MKQLTIIIGGDLAPTLSNYSIFESGSIESIIDEKILNLIRSADCRIFNLEVPLTDKKAPIRKDGPNLIAPSATVKGIALIGPDVLTLANNHILDQDEQGLFQTIELLDNNGIKCVGAGKNLNEAAIPLILERRGLKIGIYACGENEFTIAGEKTAGANPFDPLESPDHIEALKAQCDFVIVLHHGGKEHYRYPTPGLRKVCRKMADKGADLVVCQHSHCIGAFEKHKDSTIVYGQGNFLFDRNDNEFWKTGLLLKVSLGEKLSLEYIPFCKKGNGVQLVEKDNVDSILGPFMLRSEQIMKPGFVESEFARYCDENGQYYMAVFAGFGKIVRNIDKLLKGFFTKQLYSGKKAALIQNHVECESQRETVIEYLNNKRLRN
jgi:poly-gamma-glutamate synthesis protein (capsule biosynthesis protein)